MAWPALAKALGVSSSQLPLQSGKGEGKREKGKWGRRKGKGVRGKGKGKTSDKGLPVSVEKFPSPKLPGFNLLLKQHKQKKEDRAVSGCRTRGFPAGHPEGAMPSDVGLPGISVLWEGFALLGQNLSYYKIDKIGVQTPAQLQRGLTQQCLRTL